MPEPMPDARLDDIGKALAVTEGPTIAHELYDEAVRARTEVAALLAQRGNPRIQYGVRYPSWPTVSEAPNQEAARAWVEQYAALDPLNPPARVQRRTILVARNTTPWEDVDKEGADHG